MRGFLIGRLAVGRERHLAVQEMTPGRKVSPEPDDAADVVIIKGRGLTNRRARRAVFSPLTEISHVLP